MGGMPLLALIARTPARAVHHHAVALQCLRARKHVFVEKPLAISPAECDDLIACAQENDVRLFVDHTFLFNSSIHKIQQIIDGDTTIGSPLYFYAKRTNLGPFRTDGT